MPFFERRTYQRQTDVRYETQDLVSHLLQLVDIASWSRATISGPE
jgi:hypothetical protein